MNIEEIANQIILSDKRIILLYAFNTTGKTRLSVAFKDQTEDNNGGSHAGVYYNAFSEDLFVWDNDTLNKEDNIKLLVNHSSLNNYHSSLTEEAIREKLAPIILILILSSNYMKIIQKKELNQYRFLFLKKMNQQV